MHVTVSFLEEEIRRAYLSKKADIFVDQVAAEREPSARADSPARCA